MFVLNPWTHFQVQFVAYAPPPQIPPVPRLPRQPLFTSVLLDLAVTLFISRTLNVFPGLPKISPSSPLT